MYQRKTYGIERNIEFYEKNKELIDEHLLPIISGNIIGGRPAIMYRKWAWDLASKIHRAELYPSYPVLTRHLQGIDDNEYCELAWTEWHYDKIERVFLMFGKCILENVYKQTLATYHFPLDSEDK